MTFDQLTHMLAVLAWPTVALIAGIAAVYCCRMLVEALTDALTAESERWRKSRFELALLVEERRSRTTLRATRMSQWPDILYSDERELAEAGRNVKIGKAAETALLTLLAANGGFPGTRNDDATRQIVREVRKLYEEVAKPTPEPVGAREKVMAAGAGADTDADDLTLDEVFGVNLEDQDEEDEL